MKCFLLLIFLILSPLCLSLSFVRHRERSRDPYETYIDPITPISGYDAVKKEVNGNTAISEIGSLPTNFALSTKQNSWITAKSLFAKEEKIQTMLKFLHLRMIDTLSTVNSVFTSFTSTYEKPKENSNHPCRSAIFEGKYSDFNTPCIIVKISPTVKIQGRFKFKSGGSQTITSDIDFSVDFIEGGQDLTIFQRLQANAVFIRQFNKKFLEVHGASPLKVYDVNLYSLDFGSPDIISFLVQLKSDAPKWKNFASANRLSQLLILYNDARNVYQHKTGMTVQVPSTEINTIKTDSIPSNEFCGQYLLLKADGITTLAVTDPRSSDDTERNNAMIAHIQNAGTSNENVRRRLCHTLAANYFALEAYVSYGSVIDMLSLQNILKPDELPSGSKTFVQNLDQDARIDAILMNFAYAVEHYYEAFAPAPHDNEDAQKKFAKYASRLLRNTQKLTNNQHKNCWKEAFTTGDHKIFDATEPLVTTANTLDDVKKLIVKVREKISSEDEVGSFAISKNFVSQGYNCVKTYGLQLVDTRSAHNHNNHNH